MIKLYTCHTCGSHEKFDGRCINYPERRKSHKNRRHYNIVIDDRMEIGPKISLEVSEVKFPVKGKDAVIHYIPCVLFTGSTSSRGYPYIRRNGQTYSVWKYIFQFLFPEVPVPKRAVRCCSHKTCVNL